SVRLRREGIDRHLPEMRVPEEARAIEVAASHGFDFVMERLRRERAQLRKVEILEDVEHLEHDDAAARWGRHRDQLVAVILPAQGYARLRLILREIFLRDESAICAHRGGNAIGDPP